MSKFALDNHSPHLFLNNKLLLAKVKWLKKHPKPAILLFLYLMLPLALSGVESYVLCPCSTKCLPADAPASELCTVESTARYANRRGCQSGKTLIFKCASESQLVRMEEENPTAKLQPAQEGCSPFFFHIRGGGGSCHMVLIT